MSGRRLAALALVLLSGCTAQRPAPVVDYSIGPARPAPQQAPTGYVVQRGDTLYSIAFRYGLDHRALAAWNDIRRPYTIYPGQRLRLEPGDGARTARAEGAGTGVAGEPLAEPEAPTPSGPERAEPAPEPEPAEPEPAPRTEAAPAALPEAAPEDWQWPAQGKLLARFAAGEAGRNGITIAGEEGDDVVAAAPGLVVYSGSGLIGYGELIIVKHGSTFLSAYGHNRKRLVNEGDRVKAGQRIAEMGSSGAPSPRLHFEIRRDGKPVDPMRFLPKR